MIAQIITLGIIAALCSPTMAMPNNLQAWTERVLSDHHQPGWKHTLAERALERAVERVDVRMTRYSDDDALDPGTGGGPWGCSWIDPCGRRRASVKLRYGHIAADLRHWPTGSVFYAGEPYDRSWIVVDCGPGVRGRDRVDVYLPDRATWQMAVDWERRNGRRLTVYYLGRVTRAQAQGGATR